MIPELATGSDRKIASLAFLIVIVIGCGRRPSDAARMDGGMPDPQRFPEQGFIVTDYQPGEIVALQLPAITSIIVRPKSASDSNDMATIHAISGPDSAGRIAYVEDHFFVTPETNRRHSLKTIRLDGTDDTTLFTPPGDAMWATSAIGHGEIGAALALAPSGGRIAFLSGLKDLQMPSALLAQGSIEVWSIDSKTGETLDVPATDDGLSWFPDGKRLAYVKMIDRDAASTTTGPGDPIAESFLRWKWNRIPAVFIRDVDAHTETFLHTGWRPIVSVDGSKVLMSDFQIRYYCLEVATGKTELLSRAGENWPIAMLNANCLLASCMQAAGTEMKYTENNSPLRGPKQMLVANLCRIDTRESRTVIPYIDPRTHICFGIGCQRPGR